MSANQRTGVSKPLSPAGQGPRPRLSKPVVVEPEPVPEPVDEVDDYEEDLEPRWPGRSIALMILCLGGIGVSIYVTILHYAHIAPVCSDTGAVDCEAVLTSPQSVFWGVPVPVYGLIFFVGMFAFSIPKLWKTTLWWIPWLRLLGSVVGIVFALRLIYEELFAVKKICLWCTSVHVIAFLMFVIIVTGWPDATRYVIPRRARATS